MRVIFVCEGQSEQIFLRRLIETQLNLNQVSFDCIKLNGQAEEQVPYKHNIQNALINIMILNVQNDERVLSVIRDRYQNLVSRYDLIIGLRDMYSKPYPSKQVDKIHNEKIQVSIENFINNFDTQNKVKFFYMIMEFESWILSLKRMINEFIQNKTNSSIKLNLPSNPESLFRPSLRLKSILGNHNIDYNKSHSIIESILVNIQDEDIEDVLLQNNSFSRFLSYFFEIFPTDLTNESS